jgi:hypothetical protein
MAAREIAALQSGFADTFLGATSNLIALMTRLGLEGGHDMITPARTLTLVHAVQQPLGRPQFVQLPVVHRPTNPVFASALRNSFTPITAWRSHGSHSAALLGALEINGQSSSKIDLQARWLWPKHRCTETGRPERSRCTDEGCGCSASIGTPTDYPARLPASSKRPSSCTVPHAASIHLNAGASWL